MALIRALNSGVSGLRSFQTKMDVIGNNIANVETTGFKSSRVTFAELMSQRLGRADAGGESSPQMSNQVGLGVRIGSIDRDFTQGVMQNTGRGTDLAIEGRGYFLVADQGETYMTRAGNFVFNKDGFLVDQGGRHVQGYNANNDGTITPGGSTSKISIDFEQALSPKATEEITLTGNLSGDEPVRMSTTVYDGLGSAYSLLLTFTRKQDVDGNIIDNEWDVAVSSPDDADAIFVDAAGNPVTDAEVTFTESGELDVSSIPAIEVSPGGGASDFEINVELNDRSKGAVLTQFSGTNTAKVLSQDGYAQGQLLDVAIDGDGRISGIYDNGKNATLAQIAMAQVQNDHGLEMVGSGLFRATSAAGEVFINSADAMSDTTINAGSLEGSNVDLAKEFTEMITSQRAYQSNARVISTADEMLMEAVNLKR
ncbi:flagellar hook protein FlgE [Balneolales bacterium ANBcel1]|nr:flagellar hook protein FlgE [Balneolales bacterium ANBcel1]